jgi:hypothetical protein
LSHQPERKEKDCLNCGTNVYGRFCHICGQENIQNHQNFISLSKHFVYDIFHFDGKFFDTLKYLLFKPGIVAKEYVKGKRSKYLDPIRMYLFTSAIFFLLFFSFAKPETTVAPENNLTQNQRAALLRELESRENNNVIDTILLNDIAALKDSTKRLKRSDIKSLPPRGPVDINGSGRFSSVSAYDSFQNLLPAEKRDNWLQRRVTKKGIALNSKYSGNIEEGISTFWDVFLHRIPYILFLSLPFFALILKLLYIRRKNFYYSDHAVFTLYHYIFSFIFLMIFFGLNSLLEWLDWGIFGWMMGALTVFWFIYLYKSMRNFYGQNRARTIGKFLLLNLLGFVTILLLFAIFIFFSIFQL